MVRLDTIGVGNDDPEYGLPPSPSYSPSIEEPSPPLRPVYLGERPRFQLWKNKILEWVKGPRPPVVHKIQPLFPRVQTYPLALLDRYLPKRRHRMWLWLFGCFCWLFSFVMVEHFYRFTGEKSVQLSCGSTLWYKNNQCSLDGMDCRPFSNSSFIFRCPGNCGTEQVLNPRAVGDQEVIYQPYVIGGGLPSPDVDPETRHYRADSFICPAAIHAGVIKDSVGGCGKLVYTGTQSSFVNSLSNGIGSVQFDAAFPFSYTFEGVSASKCSDMRWTAFGLTLTFNILVSLLTTSPTVFFASIFCSVWFQTGMGTDPPFATDPYTLVSIIMGRFLPTAFTAVVLERWIIRPTLMGLDAQIEKTIFWLGALWFGALNNYTFDVVIPISRLTPRDLEQQPGAKAALAIIITLLLVIAVVQALHIRLEGTMPRYLALYGAMGLVLLLFVAIPNLSLRIHHYILALLFLPGTRMQTRPSLVWQGLLIGLFINGLARWGWDSILQTDKDLHGDGLQFSALPSVKNVTVGATNVTVSWVAPQWPWDSVSVLVNDVEKYRGNEYSFVIERRNLSDIIDQSKEESPNTSASPSDSTQQALLGWGAASSDDESGSGQEKRDQGKIREREKLYVRFGFLAGSEAGDFTKALTVFPNGTVTMMESGPS